MHDNDDLENLTPDSIKKKDKHKELLDKVYKLEDMNDYSMISDGSFLPSSLLKEQNKKEDNEEAEDADEWFGTLVNMKGRKPKGYKNKNLFDYAFDDKKKHKIKNKDKNALTDYKKEFEPEMNLLRNLLQEQTRFTDTLQREYDSIKSTKSTARGINKTMTDLIENITAARSLSMQLVEKNVNAKKLVAELTLKEKKEFGANNGDSENLSNFASSYLKQMISERQSINSLGSEAEVSDYTEDDLFESLSENLGDATRSDDVNKYLKYERSNVTVYANINNSDVSDYEFIAKDENGNIIDDYPLPLHTSLSVNRSTNIATDTYGKKYQIIWK